MSEKCESVTVKTQMTWILKRIFKENWTFVYEWNGWGKKETANKYANRVL